MHKHLKIEYPCEWEYCIIGTNEESIRKVARDVVGGKQHTLSFSNKSRAGKYISLALKTNVTTEDERNAIYVSLRKCPEIKSVI